MRVVLQARVLGRALAASSTSARAAVSWATRPTTRRGSTRTRRSPPMPRCRMSSATSARSSRRSSLGLRTVTLRLAPAYGPGRGVRERMKKGSYAILENGQHVTSRIDIDDVARIVFAAQQHAPAKAVYLVGDDDAVELGRLRALAVGAARRGHAAVVQIFVEGGKTGAGHRNRRMPQRAASRRSCSSI